MSEARLVVAALAAARLARLVTTDTITGPARELAIRWVYEADGDVDAIAEQPSVGSWADLARADGEYAPKLAKLLVCDWCATVWTGAVAVLLAKSRRPALRGVAEVLAVSQIAGMLRAHSSS